MPHIPIAALARLKDWSRQRAYRHLRAQGILHGKQHPLDLDDLVTKGFVTRAEAERYRATLTAERPPDNRTILLHLYTVVPEMHSHLTDIRQRLQALEARLTALQGTTAAPRVRGAGA